MWVIPFGLAAAVLLYLQALTGRVTTLCPDLGPVLITYLGLFGRSERVPTATAIVAVLHSALDLEPMGGVILVYLLLVGAVSVLRELVFRERLGAQWVVSFVTGALYLLLHAAVSLILPMGGGGGDGELLQRASVVLSGTLLAPAVFSLLRMLRVGP